MKKSIPSQPRGSEPVTPVITDVVEYRIKPGVEWVDGRRIRDADTVSLSSKAAAYDLGLGRISPASQPVPPEWSVADHGGD